MTLDRSPGFGIYVHWPFCAAKCPYCDFNSHVRHQPVDQERFARAFATELATMRRRTGPREVTSIFLGGGTPSLMKPETVGAVLDAVARNWTVPDGIEVTLEANPSSVEAERFRGYRAAGVNRVSLGVQALNDRDLKFLGRLHDVSEALQAIGLAREVAAEGIRVNAVSPGMIDTEIHALSGQPDRIARVEGALPMKRAGTADEVASAILYLLSEAASYTTGAILNVSGGR